MLALSSFERHRRRLPLLTDAMILPRIAQRAEVELGDEALFLGPLSGGASSGRRAFPGPFQSPRRAYVRVPAATLSRASVGRRFAGRLFMKTRTVDRHTSRQDDLRRPTRRREGRIFGSAFTSSITVAAERIAELEEDRSGARLARLEQEACMILEPSSGGVRPGQPTGEHPVRVKRTCEFLPAEQGRRCANLRPTQRAGAFGHPETGTAEKGEALFEAAAGEVVSFVREFADWPRIDRTRRRCELRRVGIRFEDYKFEERWKT